MSPPSLKKDLICESYTVETDIARTNVTIGSELLWIDGQRRVIGPLSKMSLNRYLSIGTLRNQSGSIV